MKRVFIILIALLAIVFYGQVFAAEWASSSCAVTDHIKLQNGEERMVIKVTAVSDGSAGTVTISGECLVKVQGSRLEQIVVDPEGTLVAAANFTITDTSGGVLLDTDDCTNTLHITNTVLLGDTAATTNGYDYPIIMGSMQLGLDDIGDLNATAYIYFYLQK